MNTVTRQDNRRLLHLLGYEQGYIVVEDTSFRLFFTFYLLFFLLIYFNTLMRLCGFLISLLNYLHFITLRRTSNMQ